MRLRVTRRDHLPLKLPRRERLLRPLPPQLPPLPIREHAAGALDDGHQRHVIVRLQVSLDDEVAVTRREQTVRVAVASEHRNLDVFRNLLVRRQVIALEHVRGCGVQVRVAQGLTPAGRDGLAVERGGLPLDPDPPLLQHGLIQHAEHGFAVVEQRHQRAPQRLTRDERLGAVDGIEDPGPLLRSALAEFDALLLAEDGVRREPLADERAHGRLGALVGDGHRRRVVLVVDLQRCAKVLHGDASGGVHEIRGEGDVLGGNLGGGRGGGDGSARGGSRSGARRDRKSHPDTLDDAVGGAPRRGRGRDGCGCEGHDGSRADLRCTRVCTSGRWTRRNRARRGAL